MELLAGQLVIPLPPMSSRTSSELTEKEWTAQVVALARLLGFYRYHTYRSKNSEAGWPDEALVRERLVLAELKREGGKPTPAQIVWLDKLSAAGQEIYLWFPSDLEEVGRVLGRRWNFEAGVLRATGPVGDAGFLEPGSLWIAGKGRRDS